MDIGLMLFGMKNDFEKGLAIVGSNCISLAGPIRWSGCCASIAGCSPTCARTG